MKRLSLLLAIFIVIFSCTSCLSNIPGDVSNVSIEYGQSEIYSKGDIDSAIHEVKKHFSKHFNGCHLFTIKYEGDETALNNLDYVGTLNEEAEYVNAIVFTSDFRSHKHYREDSGFEPDELYEDWSWYLAREEGGNWELLTWGYC